MLFLPSCRQLRVSNLFVGCFLIWSLGGCVQELPPSKPIQLKSVDIDHFPLVDHPDYLNWARFPIGTKVVRRKTMANNLGEVIIMTTLTLKELNEKAAIVESQTTVTREGMVDQKEPQDLEYMAKFRLVDGVKIENFLLPSPNALKKDSEQVAVEGKEYLADVYEWEGTLESGKVGMKCWRSDEFPGKLLKQEIDYRDDLSTRGNESIVSVEIPTA